MLGLFSQEILCVLPGHVSLAVWVLLYRGSEEARGRSEYGPLNHEGQVRSSSYPSLRVAGILYVSTFMSFFRGWLNFAKNYPCLSCLEYKEFLPASWELNWERGLESLSIQYMHKFTYFTTPQPCLASPSKCHLSYYFIFYIFIYFWLNWVFVAAHRLSLVVARGGYSLSGCTGFSLPWLLLLRSTRCAGFSSCGTWAQ